MISVNDYKVHGEAQGAGDTAYGHASLQQAAVAKPDTTQIPIKRRGTQYTTGLGFCLIVIH